MGYEMQLVIGHLTGFDPQTEATLAYEMKYGRSLIEIARLDLSVIGTSHLGSLIRKRIQGQKVLVGEGYPRVGFYASDGATLIMEDKYGDPVTPITLTEILEATEQEIRYAESTGQDPYRRLRTLQVLASDLLNYYPEYQLVALTYGH